jgi:predicted tellurium resistance membrane protein TerC
LFIAVFFIEVSDLIFALDSIPAIFAITTDPFIVWTSNIFAILGLRALYFALAGMVDRFYLLKYGVALILVFVGLKMMIEPWVQISTAYSLLVIAIILISFAWVSILSRPKVR